MCNLIQQQAQVRTPQAQPLLLKTRTLASDLTSTAPIKSSQNLQQLNPTAYNQWLALVAQTLITDGQRYESRVEAAMKRLRDGDEP